MALAYSASIACASSFLFFSCYRTSGLKEKLFWWSLAMIGYAGCFIYAQG